MNKGRGLSIDNPAAVSSSVHHSSFIIHRFSLRSQKMATHAEGEHEHFAGSNKLFISVWVWLLLLTGVEVFLGYIHVPIHLMLTILIGLSIVKAALIVAYFMHLRFERLSLVLTLVPVLVVCICLMLFVFFPDSLRSSGLRYEFESSKQVPESND
jgi:cytochrome c oxidase subunit IV